MKPVAFAGLPGAGKTTLGAALAERLGLGFVDSDQAVERCAGMTVARLFAERGEAHFRAIEREVVANLAKERDLVIALGGGAFQDEATRALLLQTCVTIWLDPPRDILLERLRPAPPRPLLADRDLEQAIAALDFARRAAFAQAHLWITEHRLEPAIAEIERSLASLGEDR